MSHTRCNEVNFLKIACSQLGCCHLPNFSNATLITINLSSDRSLSKQYQVVTKPPSETLLHLLMKAKLKFLHLAFFFQIHLTNIFATCHHDIQSFDWFINQADYSGETVLGSRSNDWDPDWLFLMLQACSFYYRLLNEYLLQYFSCQSKLTKSVSLAYSTGLPWCWPLWYQQINWPWILTSSQSIPRKDVAGFESIWKQLLSPLPVRYIKSRHRAPLIDN